MARLKETFKNDDCESLLKLKAQYEEAFNFYKSVFGGEFLAVIGIQRQPAVPATFPEADKERIMHIALPIGKGTTVDGNRLTRISGTKVTLAISSLLHLFVTGDARGNGASLQRFISRRKGRSAGARYVLGRLLRVLSDKFGVQWMFNQSKNNQ